MGGRNCTHICEHFNYTRSNTLLYISGGNPGGFCTLEDVCFQIVQGK